MAAGYTEVWNLPEASRHAARPAQKKGAAGKLKAGSKLEAKAGSKHAAGAAGHKAPHVASAGGAAAGTVAHGGVKQVAVKGKVKGCAKVSAACKSGTKAVVTAQAKKPHASIAQTQTQAKPHPGKIVHANLVQSGAARAHPVKVAAKPVASHINAPAASANVSAAAPDAATNPATASSGSLPPILH